MKVKCIMAQPGAEQEQLLGITFDPRFHFHITPGREYLVMGIEMYNGPSYMGNTAAIHYVSDYGMLVSAPLLLFEIIDPRCSRYWEARQFPDGTVVLWPPSFFMDYYHDRLVESVPEIEQDFKRVYELLLAESMEPT